MFYALPNLKATVSFALEKPWEFKAPDFQGTDKESYKRWCISPLTDHAFITAYEGAAPLSRLTSLSDKTGGNVPVRMHGLIVDYDARQDIKERVHQALSEPPCEYLPAYFYSTLRHMRAVWIFQEPIALPFNATAYRRFIATVTKNLQLHKWAAGLEAEALVQPQKYYALHGEWLPVAPEFRVPSSLLRLWAFEAVQKLRPERGEVEIPLSEVKEEIEKRWPGRWEGPFEEGARGCRIWDPSATDETMCQVHKDGLYVYNADPKAFMRWSDLFGDAFVEKYKADRMNYVVDRVVFNEEDNAYWMWMEGAQRWAPWIAGNFAPFLADTVRLSDEKPKGGGVSEVVRCMQTLQKEYRVEGARPQVYFPAGVITTNGKRILNTSRCKALDPAPPGTVFTFEDLRRYAPNITKFLTSFFDDPVDARHPVPQLLFFLGWLKRFYVGAYEQQPQQGQVAVFVGPPASGKTFLVDAIIGRLGGGVGDAGKHLTQDMPWTDFLEYGVVKVDDGIGTGASQRKHAAFCEMLKALVSNPVQKLNTKYRKTVDLEWLGRVVLNMNEDILSMDLMPSLDRSSAEKYMLFKVKRPINIFTANRKDAEAWLDVELPMLARFLIEWEYPEVILDRDSPRYLIKPYHHPDLADAAQACSVANGIREYLEIWAPLYIESLPNTTQWKGTAAELFSIMSNNDMMKPLMRETSPRAMGIGLSDLARLGIVTVKTLHGSKVYTIPLARFERSASSSNNDSSEEVKVLIETLGIGGDDGKRTEESVLPDVCAEAPVEGAGTEGGNPQLPGALLAGDGGNGGSGSGTAGGSPGTGGPSASGPQDVGGGSDGKG